MPILKIRGLTPAVCKFTSSMVVDATFPMCSLFIFWDVSTNIWLIIFMTVYLVVFVDSSEHLCRTGKKMRYMLHSQASNWAHLLFVIFSLPSNFLITPTKVKVSWNTTSSSNTKWKMCLFLGVGQTPETLSQSKIHFLKKISITRTRHRECAVRQWGAL